MGTSTKEAAGDHRQALLSGIVEFVGLDSPLAQAVADFARPLEALPIFVGDLNGVPGEPRLREDGWRYLIEAANTVLAVDLRLLPDARLRVAGVTQNRRFEGLLRLSRATADRPGYCPPRLLRIPEILVDVLWLKGIEGDDSRVNPADVLIPVLSVGKELPVSMELTGEGFLEKLAGPAERFRSYHQARHSKDQSNGAPGGDAKPQA